MEELIKFRRFVETMPEHEFETALVKINQIVGKDALISSLFHHFQENLNQATSRGTTRAQLSQINQKISAIHDDPLILSPKIDKLPESIINEIASYLDIICYCQFERCNRTIFISARSPFQLHNLVKDDIVIGVWQYLRYCMKNGIEMDKKKFSRLRSLRFHPTQNTELLYKQLLFEKIHELKFVLNTHTDILMQTFESSVMSNNIHFKHLETLEIGRYDSSSNNFFNSLLSKILHFQFLKLEYSETPTVHSMNEEIFKQLKGISLTSFCALPENWNNRMNRSLVAENAILDLCSLELLSFHSDLDFSRLNVNYDRFPNLQELYLEDNHNEKIIEQIKQFKNLKRVHLDFLDYTGDSIFNLHLLPESSIPLTTQFMNKLFSLKKLEYIEFDISEKELPKLMKLVQNALLLNRKKKLKIYIHCVFSEEVSNDNIYLDFEVFVNALSHHITDFMFIFYGELMQQLEDQEIDDINTWLESLPENGFLVNDDFCEYYFIVANKGCKINGYCKRNLMKEKTYY